MLSIGGITYVNYWNTALAVAAELKIRPIENQRAGLRLNTRNSLMRVLRIVCAITLAAMSVATARAQSAKLDVTGTWMFTVLSEAGTGTPTVTFKQDGEKLTGHYSSMLVGEADLTGTVKGQAIEFTVKADIGGMPLEFKFTGTIEDKDSIKGKLDTGGLGDASFTGKRK
jgi:hypothetical protein